MTSEADVVNQALDEIGARVVVSDLTDNTPQARVARRWYGFCKDQVLRTAPWAFARRTLPLSLLGTLTDTPPGSPVPFLFKYAYPSDCLKLRYIIPTPVIPSIPAQDLAPNVSEGPFFPWCGPRREWRFLVNLDVDPNTGFQSKTVIANLNLPLAVYTADVTSPDLWDPLFQNALVSLLASKFVQPLTGNAGMKKDYEALARDAVLQARVADGNESITTADPRVDWIDVRGVPNLWAMTQGLNGSAAGGWGWGGGDWYSGYDSFQWSM